MGAGRPFGILKYSNVDDLENGIVDYFADCKERAAPYTLSGLAYWLDIDSKTLYNYSKIDKYFPTIHRARERCRQYAHESLYDRDKSRGAQFDLSANYDMSERVKVDSTISGDFAININVVNMQDLHKQDTLPAKKDTIMID
jgi:hypothetical protein